ncbi:MAG: hypothetical protein PHV17_10270 [Candidatus Omnitrophica bacterium]|nr:hypothetical protein [Candidatus Omnitrophota bacterium]
MKISGKIIYVLIFNIILISGSVIAGYGKNNIYFYFQERQAVTFISALLLGLTSLCAFIASFVWNQCPDLKKRFNFWIISFFGFFYLSMDEYFMMHEGMDTPSVRMLGKDPQSFNLDGLFFALLGIVGIIIALKFWKEISRYRDFILLCVLGVFCLGGMVVFDMINQDSPLIKVIEESFKITGVTFFFAAFLSVVLTQIKQAINGDELSGSPITESAKR